ncbi:MAG: methylated-DNA--[protein]-cysteine S-methyltransferase [Steroidobacteraceae bacterium]
MMPQFLDVDSPVGTLRLVAESGALVRLELRPGPRARALRRGWAEDAGAAPFAAVTAQLREYFAGGRRAFDVPLDLRGTAFQRQVWQALCEIPHGETRSYGEIAARIGSEGGSRAVGLANHENPVPLIVPCHRVINADGTLGGFGGGVELKRWLLRHEGAEAAAQSALPW